MKGMEKSGIIMTENEKSSQISWNEWKRKREKTTRQQRRSFTQPKQNKTKNNVTEQELCNVTTKLRQVYWYSYNITLLTELKAGTLRPITDKMKLYDGDDTWIVDKKKSFYEVNKVMFTFV